MYMCHMRRRIQACSARARSVSCVRGRCPYANLQTDATTRNYLSQHGVGCSPLVGAPARAGGSAAEARAGARILKRMQSTKKKVGVTCVEKKKQA